MVLACAAAAALTAFAPTSEALGRGPAGAQETSDKPVPLVNVDDELAAYLKQAARHVTEKEYSKAIEILQSLINRDESYLLPASDDGRLFVSLRAKAGELIGSMDADGLKLFVLLAVDRRGAAGTEALRRGGRIERRRDVQADIEQVFQHVLRPKGHGRSGRVVFRQLSVHPGRAMLEGGDAGRRKRYGRGRPGRSVG